jgi:hypothetical protein
MEKNTQTECGIDLRKLCAEKLKLLKPNLSTQDKADALIKFNLSRPTLEKYLNCDEVPKLTIGTKLLTFFKECVTKTSQLITK